MRKTPLIPMAVGIVLMLLLAGCQAQRTSDAPRLDARFEAPSSAIQSDALRDGSYIQTEKEDQQKQFPTADSASVSNMGSDISVK